MTPRRPASDPRGGLPNLPKGCFSRVRAGSGSRPPPARFRPWRGGTPRLRFDLPRSPSEVTSWRMPRSPRVIPVGVDGEALAFRAEPGPLGVLAVTTTGCFAVRTSDGTVRVHHWYYRWRGKDPVVVAGSRWLALWSCRAPWDASPAGHVTHLDGSRNELVALDVGGLSRLALLKAAHNHLERLDLSGLMMLRAADLAGNELASLSVDGCRHLERLRLGGNPRLRATATALLAVARGDGTPVPSRRHRPASTSLFDL